MPPHFTPTQIPSEITIHIVAVTFAVNLDATLAVNLASTFAVTLAVTLVLPLAMQISAS